MTDNPYKLSAEEHAEIYKSKIAARYLSKSQAQEQPCAFITGGQPGSGKSGLAEMAKDRFQEQGYILVDADKLRPFHPHFDRLLETNDKQAADLTHSDCGSWARQLLIDGAKGKRNLIIDQTSRDPAAMENLTDQLQKTGYRVELHVMAVSPEVSEQRIHQRYEGQKARNGYGRFSNKENHDKAYAGIPETIEAVEAKKLVNKVCLYDYRLEPCYQNDLQGGKWQKPTKARETLESERAKPMTPQQAHEYAENYRALVKMVNAPSRGATLAEKATIQALHTNAAELALSAKTMDKIVKDLQAKPLPRGLNVVVSYANPQKKQPYVGKIIAMTGRHVLQQIGANKFVVHDRKSNALKELQQGKQISISYSRSDQLPATKNKNKEILR